MASLKGNAASEEGSTLAADGARLAWRRSGSAADPAIVLIHGIGNHAGCWCDIPERLVAGGSQVVALDLRAHGHSSSQGPFSVERLAGDVGAVLRELGICRPVLVGHSLGALVCLALASSPQVDARAIVNIDQSLRLGEFAAVLRSLWPRLLRDFHGTMAPVFDAMMPTALPARERALLADGYRSMNASAATELWAPLVDLDPEAVASSVDQLLAGACVPYVAIHGGEPNDDYRAWLRKRVSASTLEVWEGGGHFPHLVDPGRFAARVLQLAAN